MLFSRRRALTNYISGEEGTRSDNDQARGIFAHTL